MIYYVGGKRLRPLRIAASALVLVAVVWLWTSVAGSSNSAEDTAHDGLHHKPAAGAFASSLLRSKCPDYTDYSKEKHPPLADGVFHYPFMRPQPQCRTFVSPAVEQVIDALKQRAISPDLARLIENCLPNTLDTTILWHTAEVPFQSFVVTGDIHAEWLRDAARQLSVYQPLVKYDKRLRNMVLGAINTQTGYVLHAPYCNAFHPPKGLGVKKGESAVDNVYPRPDWSVAFECKWELDLLASFVMLVNEYFEHSGGDLGFVDDRWLTAIEVVLAVLARQSQPSFNEAGQAQRFYYHFLRQTNIGSETLPLGGVGNPVNYGTGLVRSAFRPSDDATIYQFFIPANAQMLTELAKLRNIYNVDTLKAVVKDAETMAQIEALGTRIDGFIASIKAGIQNHGIVHHPVWGKVYAYEVDGYGSTVSMDDANIPSLLSLPDMGFVDVDDEVYQNTRKMVLSKSGNPYFLKGRHFEGIGGPHIGIKNAWPMSLLVRIRTTNNDDEIRACLDTVMKTTAGLGLMHESVNVDVPGGRDYTRSWFAWCNSEFGKTILHLAKHKPHLIFKTEYASTPFDIERILTVDQ